MNRSDAGIVDVEPRREGSATPKPSARSSLGILFVALLASALLRFAGLGTMIVWPDEVWTGLWLSGRDVESAVTEVASRVEWSGAGLRELMTVRRDAGVRETLAAVLRDDPKHLPLYYAALRLWAGVFGDTPARLRALSASAGCLAVLLAYWLGLEVSGSRRGGGLVALCFAMSPFHAVMSQEARPYSLWIATIVGSTAALLRAVRRDEPIPWMAYAVLMLAGMATHLLFGLVVVAHACWGLWLSIQTRAPRLFLKQALASGAASLLVLLPASIAIFRRMEMLQENSSWLATPASPLSVAKRLYLFLSTLVVDTSGTIYVDIPRGHDGWQIYLERWPAVLLVVIAITFLFSREHVRRGGLIVALCLVPALLLVVPDMLGGGSRSTARFLGPIAVSGVVAVGLLLERLMSDTRRGAKVVGTGILVAVVFAGALSGIMRQAARTWWHKGEGAVFADVAATLDAYPAPIVIGKPFSGTVIGAISVASVASPETRFFFVSPPAFPRTATAARYTFFLLATEEERRAFAQRGLLLVEEPHSWGVLHRCTPVAGPRLR